MFWVFIGLIFVFGFAFGFFFGSEITEMYYAKGLWKRTGLKPPKIEEAPLDFQI